MERVGLAGRVLLILMLALFSVIIISVGLDVLAYRQAAEIRPVLAPRVVHTAGLIALLRGADPATQRRILRLGSNPLLRVDISRDPSESTADDWPAPHLEAMLRKLVGDDRLRAFTDRAMATRPEDADRYGDGRITKVIAPLGEGQSVLIQWIDRPQPLAFTVLGLPPSVLAGILGFGVAALALRSTLREVRPLRRLTASVTRFDGIVPDKRITDGGAPDLRRLAEAVHEMQTRVAGLLAERSFLIGAISHDLKTYLTRLRLRAESVAEEDLRERMVADVKAMTDLLETALAFARGTSSSGSRKSVDLGDLVATEVEERRALDAAVRIEGRYGSEAIVLGDAVALRRVLFNLVENAAKFGGGIVVVSLECTPSRARMIVEDDGPGIAPAECEAIFDPFVRLEGSRSRRTGGSGLGLAIARQIVETHGGTITVGTSTMGGATLTVELPRLPVGGTALRDASHNVGNRIAGQTVN